MIGSPMLTKQPDKSIGITQRLERPLGSNTNTNSNSNTKSNTNNPYC